MSLYNSLFGVNTAAPLLLKMIGKTSDDFGRFRDCYLSPEWDKIIVYTRCGGGNREDYQEVFDEMEGHPNYLSNYDDDFDCTYAYFEFSIPDEYKEDVKLIAGMTPPTQKPSEKFQQLINDLQSGATNEQTDKAMEVGAKIFEEIDKTASDGEDKIIRI
jgi:hypothetical protein